MPYQQHTDPSLSKYYLIANQEDTEKINGHPIPARKEKSNPRENPFQGDATVYRVLRQHKANTRRDGVRPTVNASEKTAGNVSGREKRKTRAVNPCCRTSE